MKKTELATPGVKHRSEMYYGSPSATIGGGGDPRAKSGNKAQQGDRAGSSTLGNTGVSKVCFLCYVQLTNVGRGTDAIDAIRINFLVQRLRILMLRMRLRVRLARLGLSRGGSFVRVVRIRGMVCLSCLVFLCFMGVLSRWEDVFC